MKSAGMREKCHRIAAQKRSCVLSVASGKGADYPLPSLSPLLGGVGGEAGLMLGHFQPILTINHYS